MGYKSKKKNKLINDDKINFVKFLFFLSIY